MNETNNIKLAVTDLDGILRGKYISKKKYESALKNGFGFCDVIFGWDCEDYLYEQDSFTGWAKGFSDARAKLDESTKRDLQLTEEKKCFLVLADFEGGEAETVCPRSLLKRVLKKAESMGYKVDVAVEFEFFLFNETIHSIREKNYFNLQNMTPDMFGYSVLRISTHSHFYHQILDMCEKMEMRLEGIHTETGPGVIEAALEYTDALRMADNAVLFKTFTKTLAQKNNLIATFMAKYHQNYPGQSGHIHISLTSEKGESVFYDANKENSISDTMIKFIGGQQKLMPEFLSMVAHNCNSYTRLIPGFWAPTTATWGIDNRTCAIRAIPGSPKSQRIEYRVAAADINPYLALSAAIGSGLWGIENKVQPQEPIKGNAYEQKQDISIALPLNLSESAKFLENSEPAKILFGEDFVKHYSYTRQSEAEYQRRAVTNWQLQRYFEII